MRHQPLDIRTWNDNPWSTIADRWMLVTAGSMDSWNTMTASWGGFGHLWNRDVAFVFVRPTRHTFGFMEKSGSFSLSFFDEDWRGALATCGRVSGRDCDKAALTGLVPEPFGYAKSAEATTTATAAAAGTVPGAVPGAGAVSVVGFRQARIVLACRKLHAQDLDPACFVDPAIAENYKARDWHRLYVASIEAAWRLASPGETGSRD
ncbi:MAG: flavin reductase family protein [Rectinemataceae bacterium]|nr:flavin reductase family protein [Rectinemataceae bacterium]